MIEPIIIHIVASQVAASTVAAHAQAQDERLRNYRPGVDPQADAWYAEYMRAKRDEAFNRLREPAMDKDDRFFEWVMVGSIVLGGIIFSAPWIMLLYGVIKVAFAMHGEKFP